MKLSYRKVKKAIKKCRAGRDISNSELVIINKKLKIHFNSTRLYRMALSVASNVSQLAIINSQPVPFDQDPVIHRIIKAKRMIEAVLDSIEVTRNISSERFNPLNKKALEDLYNPKQRNVGNYGTCSNIAGPITKFECRDIRVRHKNIFIHTEGIGTA